MQAFESDERILSYPVIVQVSPADATVVVDKQKDRRIRPSVVARHLADLQQRPPKFRAEAFIESLVTAYDYVVAAKALRPGSPAKLVDVHRVLTLLPGAGPGLHPPGVRPGYVPARPERPWSTSRTAGA